MIRELLTAINLLYYGDTLGGEPLVMNSSGSVTSDGLVLVGFPRHRTTLRLGSVSLYGRSAILAALSQPVLARHTGFAVAPATTVIVFAAVGLLLLWRCRAGAQLAIGIVTLLLGVRILILILALILPSTIVLPLRPSGIRLSLDLVLKLAL